MVTDSPAFMSLLGCFSEANCLHASKSLGNLEAIQTTFFVSYQMNFRQRTSIWLAPLFWFVQEKDMPLTAHSNLLYQNASPRSHMHK